MRLPNPSLATRSLLEELPDRLRQMLEGTLALEPLAEPIGWMPAMEIVDENGALVVTVHRAFTLPREVDAEKISAKFDNVVLTVTLPKSEKVKVQGKKIPITGSK